MKQKLIPVFLLWAGITLVWALYRAFFSLPELFEEIILKPLIFITPLIFYLQSQKILNREHLGLRVPQLKPFLIWGVGFGLFLIFEMLVTTYFKNGSFTQKRDWTTILFIAFAIESFLTAFSEEILYRGFILQKLWEVWTGGYLANFITALLFMVGHLGLALLVLRYSGLQLGIYLFSMFILGYANGFIFKKTRSVYASTFFHGLWNLSISLLI